MSRDYIAMSLSDNEEFPFRIHLYINRQRCDYLCKEVPVVDTNYCKIVTSNNEVAILYTCDYGAHGWSTMESNPELSEQISKDSRIIKYRFGFDFNKMEYNDFMTKIIGLEDPPSNIDWGNLSIKFICQGELYIIRENEGLESVSVFDPTKYRTA